LQKITITALTHEWQHTGAIRRRNPSETPLEPAKPACGILDPAGDSFLFPWTYL